MPTLATHTVPTLTRMNHNTPDGEDVFFICGTEVANIGSNDVSIDVPDGSEPGGADFPKCPDCGDGLAEVDEDDIECCGCGSEFFLE